MMTRVISIECIDVAEGTVLAINLVYLYNDNPYFHTSNQYFMQQHSRQIVPQYHQHNGDTKTLQSGRSEP